MSSLSLQAGQIRAALISAGLPASAATNVASILGNAAQTLRHSGEVITDRTPPGLRFVDPDLRKHSLTNADFRQADPDFRTARSRPSEDARRPAQESTVRTDRAPQQTEAARGFQSGDFVSVQPSGDEAQVGLRIAGAGDLVFADRQSGTLVTKNLRAEAAGFGGAVRFAYQPDGPDVVLRLLFDDASLGVFQQVDVVTGVAIVPNQGIQITKRRMSGYFSGEPVLELLPTTNISVVTELSLGGGVVGTRANVQVLGVQPDAPSFVPAGPCGP